MEYMIIEVSKEFGKLAAPDVVGRLILEPLIREGTKKWELPELLIVLGGIFGKTLTSYVIKKKSDDKHPQIPYKPNTDQYLIDYNNKQIHHLQNGKKWINTNEMPRTLTPSELNPSSPFYPFR